MARFRIRQIALACGFAGLAALFAIAVIAAMQDAPPGAPAEPSTCPTATQQNSKGLDSVLLSGPSPIDNAMKVDRASYRQRLDRMKEAALRRLGLQALSHPTTDFASLCRYRADNAVLAGTPAASRIVYFGDSITENWKFADPDLFAGAVVNRGISGQTTAQALLRFRQDVVDLHPSAVFILLGTNDFDHGGIITPLGEITRNLQTMVELARGHQMRVILCTVPPARFGPPHPLDARAQVAALNDWLRTYATENEIALVDYHAVLTAPDGFYDPLLSNDGVHPNRAGYARMKPVAEQARQPSSE